MSLADEDLIEIEPRDSGKNVIPSWILSRQTYQRRESKNRFYTKFLQGASRFDLVNDKKLESNLLTESHSALSFFYEYQRKKWIYLIGMELNGVNIDNPEDYEISNNSFSKLLAKAGVGYEFNEKLSGMLTIGEGLLIIPESGDETEIKTSIEAYQYFQASLKYNYFLKKSVRLVPQLSLASSLGDTTPNNFTIQSGILTHAGIDLSFDRKNYSFILGFDYEALSFYTKGGVNHFDSIIANFGFQFNL